MGVLRVVVRPHDQVDQCDQAGQEGNETDQETTRLDDEVCFRVGDDLRARREDAEGGDEDLKDRQDRFDLGVLQGAVDREPADAGADPHRDGEHRGVVADQLQQPVGVHQEGVGQNGLQDDRETQESELFHRTSPSCRTFDG